MYIAFVVKLASWHPVGTGEHAADHRRRAHRPRGRIGAAVGDEVDLGRLDHPVRFEGHLDGRLLVTGLAGGKQVLAPIFDPFHGAATLRRREHQAHLVALHHDLLTKRHRRYRASTTRIRCSGMPSSREQNSRTSCGDWVDE